MVKDILCRLTRTSSLCIALKINSSLDFSSVTKSLGLMETASLVVSSEVEDLPPGATAKGSHVVLLETASLISFIKSRKRCGPRTVPCGTPLRTYEEPVIVTLC